ncbi:MAG: glutathione S-transferase family protein [Proteobacteria bacterium]|nr:glutathione S-transferase family protein [Pseudomonadota bacterium]
MLKLYHGVTSTCSKRVRITLAEKGLAWESHHIDLRKFDQLEPWYLELNPNGVVPTLVHDGKVCHESNFIIEYLDEAFPDKPLRPDDPHGRWKMRVWMNRFEHILHRNVNVISFIKQNRAERYTSMSKEEFDAFLDRQATAEKRMQLKTRVENGVTQEDMDFAEARIAEVLDDMETALAEGPWLTGERLSLADISIAPFIERFEGNKLEKLVDWTARPRLGGWWRRMQGLESFKTAFAYRPPA